MGGWLGGMGGWLGRKTWHFFRFLARRYAPAPKIEKNALKISAEFWRKLGGILDEFGCENQCDSYVFAQLCFWTRRYSTPVFVRTMAILAEIWWLAELISAEILQNMKSCLFDLFNERANLNFLLMFFGCELKNVKKW